MTTPAETTFPCPACNYDCRGLSRCPECGLDLSDPTIIRQRTLPWANRKTLGRPRAFLRTALAIYQHPRELANAAYLPQDDRDARRFAWLCVLTSLPLFALITYFGSVPFIEDLLRAFQRQGSAPFQRFLSTPAAQAELFHPLNLALGPWTLTFATCLALLLCPFSLATPFALIRQNSCTTERALRCAALTRYFAASLFPIALMFAVLVFLPRSNLFRTLLFPGTRYQILLLAGVLLSLSAAPLLLYPIILFRYAGAEWWQVPIAALIYLLQFFLIAALAYFAIIHLPGLALLYRELWH